VEATVLVPTWRRAQELGRCLDALAAQTRRPDEVIVVARAQDDETWRLLGAREEDGLPLRSLRVETQGVVASLNAGLDAARGDLVAITDDDAEPRPEWLERIERHLRREPDLGGVGGRDWMHQDGRVLDGEEPVVGRIRWFGRVIGRHHLGAGPPREVDMLKGANMAVRAEALRGMRLDESLRGSGMQMHWEMGLCLALKRAGWRLLYDPEVAVDHYSAPRFDEDQRVGRSLVALENEVYNHTRTLLGGLSWWRKPFFLGYGLLVGARWAPGVVTGLELTIRGRRQPGAYAACTRARLQAAAGLIRAT
jgi:glycosyltransferase involved in cell wall biosynthesis